MGRELRRVPLDFNWPLNKPYEGFINPHYEKQRKCESCEGSGYCPQAKRFTDEWYGRIYFDAVAYGSKMILATDERMISLATQNVDRDPNFFTDPSFVYDHVINGELVRRLLKGRLTREEAISCETNRLVGIFCNQWSHNLIQADVDALIAADRLCDFTHQYVDGKWVKKEGPLNITAEMVNEWSLRGIGHDSINQHICVAARMEREGFGKTTCELCGGHGRIWFSPEAEKAANEWEPTDPPNGDGFQVWETVSEGSPITPVFATAEELIDHLVNVGDHPSSKYNTKYSLEAATKFVMSTGWVPSAMIVDGQLYRSIEATTLLE